MFQEKIKQIQKEKGQKYSKPENENVYKLIDKCVEFEIISYYRFLITKTGLQQIKHRKIVQNMFTNYLPQQKLKLDVDCLIHSNIDNKEIDQNQFKQLQYILQWPSNLQHLILDLSLIDFYEKNMNNIKNLAEGIQYLSYKLTKLELYYKENYLGQQKEDMQYLQVIMKQLPKSLQYFQLNLNYNNFGYDQEGGLNHIASVLKQLPNNLQHFVLEFDYYQIGQNQQYLKEFCDALKSLPYIKIQIIMYLNDDCLGHYKQNFKYLEDIQKQMENLDLKIEFEFNGDFQKIDEYQGDQKQIIDILKNIPDNIYDLKLGFFNDPMGVTSYDYMGQGSYDLLNKQINLNLEFVCFFLGEDCEAIKYLVQGLKQLPQRIKYLQLNFKENLGQNQENYQYLSDGLKQLPSNLVKFELILQGTNLGENQEDFKYFSEGLKQLPYNLQNLQLDLSKNTLIGQNIENIIQIGDALKQLPINLQYLKISIWGTNLGINYQNFKYLGECFKQLPHNLMYLSIDLQNSKIGENNENLYYLSEGIKKLGIKNLEINLGNNQLGFDFKDCLKQLGEQLNLIKNLESLQIDLSQNELVEKIDKQVVIQEYFQILEKKLQKLELIIDQHFYY